MRDNFSPKTRQIIAARAGWRCSFEGCDCPTIGPSDESPLSTTMIGEAAHISAASPGPGARRYDEALSSEERSDISNAIWLCATHARLIDRDEVTYTSATLKQMKAKHESSMSADMRQKAAKSSGAFLFVLGPDIVFSGSLESLTSDEWILSIDHFLSGSIHKVSTFIDSYADTLSDDRYVLSNEIGDGRVLSRSPALRRANGAYLVNCGVEPRFPRLDANQLPGDLEIDESTNDLVLTARGDFAIVSGIGAFAQKLRLTLSVQRGEMHFHPRFGVRFFEFFQGFKGTPWIAHILKLDVIRQSSIPTVDDVLHRSSTPLQCVNRVVEVEILDPEPIEHRLPIHLDLEVEGIGSWSGVVSAYI